MAFIPPGEDIIETKKCKISGKEFFVTNKDLEFYDKISPVFAGKKYLIPSPKLCPDERQRRRLAFRNERKLYHRKCDKTGNQMLSMYSADKPYTVYDQKTWWSDDWNAFEYGKSFDFEKSFFSQFDGLMRSAPRINLINKNHENSEFCNFANQNRNSYLLFTSGWCEDAYYSNRAIQSKNICDCSNVVDCELCHQSIDSSGCYACRWLQNCHGCADCTFGYDLIGCRNCIGCYGLVNQEYCIGNKQFSKEEYAKKMSSTLKSLTRESFQKHLKQCVRKCANKANTENSSGDNISDCRNAYGCFESKSLENCKYIYNATELRDCYDINNNDHSELDYEVVGGESNYQECFCDISWFNKNTLYSSLCFHSQNLFGCSSLKKASHCILNTSYSRQEYETLCSKIIDHMVSTSEWGEFFSHHLSPFGYNETVAQEYFPMTEIQVKENKWNWKMDEETSSYHGAYYKPKDIEEYDERIVGYDQARRNIDELLGGILLCDTTKRPFKIVGQELAFYIKNEIQVPTKHPDRRHSVRIEQRNPRNLYESKCSQCHADIITSYSPQSDMKIFCEECYRKHTF